MNRNIILSILLIFQTGVCFAVSSDPPLAPMTKSSTRVRQILSFFSENSKVYSCGYNAAGVAVAFKNNEVYRVDFKEDLDETFITISGRFWNGIENAASEVYKVELRTQRFEVSKTTVVIGDDWIPITVSSGVVLRGEMGGEGIRFFAISEEKLMGSVGKHIFELSANSQDCNVPF